jgi:hypothetical protein
MFSFVTNFWKTYPSLVVISGQECEWLFWKSIFQLPLSVRMTCSISPSFVHWYLVSVASFEFLPKPTIWHPIYELFYFIYTVLKNGALWILPFSHQPQCSLKVYKNISFIRTDSNSELVSTCTCIKVLRMNSKDIAK